MSYDLCRAGFNPGCVFKLQVDVTGEGYHFDANTMFRATGVTPSEVKTLTYVQGVLRVISFTADQVYLQNDPALVLPKRCQPWDDFIPNLQSWALLPSSKGVASPMGALNKLSLAVSSLKNNPDNFVGYATCLFWLLVASFRAGLSFLDLRKGLLSFLTGVNQRKEFGDAPDEVPIGGVIPDVVGPIMPAHHLHERIDLPDELSFNLSAGGLRGRSITGRVDADGDQIQVWLNGFGYADGEGNHENQEPVVVVGFDENDELYVSYLTNPSAEAVSASLEGTHASRVRPQVTL